MKNKEVLLWVYVPESQANSLQEPSLNSIVNECFLVANGSRTTPDTFVNNWTLCWSTFLAAHSSAYFSSRHGPLFDVPRNMIHLFCHKPSERLLHRRYPCLSTSPKSVAIIGVYWLDLNQNTNTLTKKACKLANFTLGKSKVVLGYWNEELHWWQINVHFIYSVVTVVILSLEKDTVQTTGNKTIKTGCCFLLTNFIPRNTMFDAKETDGHKD